MREVAPDHLAKRVNRKEALEILAGTKALLSEELRPMERVPRYFLDLDREIADALFDVATLPQEAFDSKVMVLDALRDYLSGPVEGVCVHGMRRILAHWNEY